MPSSIVPIENTRQFSIIPPPDLRYGNFDKFVHLPPMTSSSGRLTARSLSELNNQQIYRKICEWFDNWKPWQQRMALCGIANRCSVRQLAILATTLEPMKHRDYYTASKKHYPQAFSPKKQIIHRVDVNQSPVEKKLKKFPKKTKEKVNVTKNNKKPKKDKNDKQSAEGSFVNTLTSKLDKKMSEPSPKLTRSLTDLADDMSKDILHSVMNEISPRKDGHLTITKDDSQTSLISDNGSDHVRNVLESTAEQLSLILPHHLASAASTRMSVTPSLNGSKATFQFDFLGSTLEYDPSVAKVKTNTTQSLLTSTQGNSPISPVQTVDFFQKNNTGILGEFQREVVNTDIDVYMSIDNLPLPLVQFYKHVKFWPATPANGKHYLKAKSNELNVNFQAQLAHIWMWMNEWEDYEKIALINEILKISTPEILQSLLDNIHQKLEEEKDLNILPDGLLLYIFSSLHPKDIYSVTQVCRRWRYLCTSDELWILKCLELGETEGIRNIPSLVIDAKSSGMLIDWKLAHKELCQLVTIMKHSLSELRHQSLEPQVIKEEIVEKYEKVVRIEPKPKRRFSKITEVQLHRGTISMLKKREEISSVLKQCVDNGQISSDSELSDEDLSPFMADYTMLPPIQAKGKSFDWCNSSRRTRRRTVVRTSLQNLTVGTDNTSVSQLTEDDSSKSELLEHGKHRDNDEDDDDKALDIRPRLVHAVDLLGKTKSSMNLIWKSTETEKEDDQDDIADKMSQKSTFAGNVKSVLKVRKLQGHMNGIMCIQYDRKRLVSAGLDRTIRIWDIRSGRSIHKLYGHKGGIRCLWFDNEILATGSWDCTIVVWSMYDYTQITILLGHSDCITCLQCTNKYIVSGSHDGSIRIWSRTIYECSHVIQHGGSVRCLTLHHGNVISAAEDMCIRIINIESGEIIQVLSDLQTSILSIVAQGSLIFGADGDGIVYFYNIDTGECEAAIQAHEDTIHNLIYYKNRFLTASSDGTIKEWDLMTMTCIRLLQGHKGPVRDVQVSDERIVSCSDDGTVRIWDLILPKTKTKP